MNSLQKLSVVLLLTTFSMNATTPLSVAVRIIYKIKNEKPYTPEDDMTDFNDLAAAGHQLRTAIHEEAKSNHLSRISALATLCNERRSAYKQCRNQCNTMLRESYRAEGHKIRSSWQWRDSVVATAVAGTVASGTAILYELTQQQYLATLGCIALTTGFTMAWGFGADWADDARFTAAYALEKKLKAEKEETQDYKELAQKCDQAELNLIQAYTQLKMSKPWTPEAKAELDKVTLPRELYV